MVESTHGGGGSDAIRGYDYTPSFPIKESFEFPHEKEGYITLEDAEGRDYSGALNQRTPASFLHNYMKQKAKIFNQLLYSKFKNEMDIDIVPVYLQWNPRTYKMNTYIRTDWLKAKIQVELDFPRWLAKKKMYKKSKIAKMFIENATWATQNGGRAPWYKNLYNEYLEDTKDNPKYSKMNMNNKPDGLTIFSIDEIRGERPTRGKKTFRGSDSDIMKYERIGSATRGSEQLTRRFFLKPLQGDDFVKMLTPKNAEKIWGDNNMKQYIKENVSNVARYNEIMKEVQDILWEQIKKVDFQKEWEKHEEVRKRVDSKGVNTGEDYFSGDHESGTAPVFEPNFPNISNIRDWYVKKGILTTKSKIVKGKETYHNADAYLKLKNNRQRANFIDNAVFLIGLAIFEKSGGGIWKNVYGLDIRSSTANARMKRIKNRGVDTRVDAVERRQFKDQNLKDAQYLTRRLRKMDNRNQDTRKRRR